MRVMNGTQPRREKLSVLVGGGVAAFAVDGDQTVMLWNDGAEEILGYTAKEATGKRCYELISGVDESGYRVCTRPCVFSCGSGQAGPSSGLWVGCESRRGVRLWLAVTHLPLCMDQMDQGGVLHIIQDVTEAHRTKLIVTRILAELDAPLPHRPLGQAGPGERLPSQLSGRELQILRLLSRGTTTQSIANELTLSVFTVRNHVRSMLSKLGARSRLEAIATARQHKLV